jgi:hypothetical protein
MKMPDPRENGQGFHLSASPAARRMVRLLGLSLAFLAFLGLYTFTLSDGLLPADAGEYQLVGATLGVAHPPGYALYTLTSWLVTHWLFCLPPAQAINFLSALLAALTLVLLIRVTHRLTASALAGYGAALALGFSTTFWAQAVTANIRMPAAFAVALALDRIAHYRRVRTPRALGWAALALGLGVSHHGSLIFIAAVLGLYMLWLNPAVLRRPWPLLLGLAPFLAWLYFPLRADIQPALGTLNGFLDHVLARGFQGDMLYFATFKDLPARLFVLDNVLNFEFNWALLSLMVVGSLAAVWRDRQSGIVLLAALAIHTFISITYRAPQTVEYLLPGYVLMAGLLGFAFAEAVRLSAWLSARRAKPAMDWYFGVAFLLVLSLGGQLAATAPSYFALARDTSTRDYAQAVLSEAPPQALVLASWNWATPLWYLQRVEHQRPDVEVRYVFPQGPSLAQNWADEISASATARPVVVTSFYSQEYGALPDRFLPLGPAWLVQRGPLTAPPANLAGARPFGAWTFIGYHLDSSTPLTATAVELTAAWQTSGAPQDISFFVHLQGADGQLVGQMDIAHPANRYVSGEVLLDRYRLVVRPGTPPGVYDLVAGAYQPDGTRLAQAALTSLRIELPAPLADASAPAVPLAVAPPPAVPLGDSIYFLGAELNPGGPLHPGDSFTVDLTFLAVRPIVFDYTVKVDLVGPDWRWHVQSEGTPVGGAIPTLKWIAGTRLTDRRTLTIPPGAAPGPAQLSVTIYDSFTQFGLPVFEPGTTTQQSAAPAGTVQVVQP